MNKKVFKKKVFSIVLVLAMVLGMIPSDLFTKEIQAAGKTENITYEQDVPIDSILYSEENADSTALSTESTDGSVGNIAASMGLSNGNVGNEAISTGLSDENDGSLTASAGLSDWDDSAMFTEPSDGLTQFVTEEENVFTEELPYYLRYDYYFGYLPLDVERSSSKVDPALSYREVRDMLVSKPSDNLSGDVKGSITDKYDFSIPSAYPAEYDDEAALENYVKTVLPPLRNQGEEGCCWAMAMLSAIENYLLANGINDANGEVSRDSTDILPGINYSELQLAYFCYRNNELKNLPEEHRQTEDVAEFYPGVSFAHVGGNEYLGGKVMMNGIGVVDEILIPYRTFTQFTSEEQMAARSGIDEEFTYNQDTVHLTNIYDIDIFNNTNQVKQAIQENHAVVISINPKIIYYNSEHNAYYNNVDAWTNHDVNAVGWDDNFPKEFFTGEDGAKPKNDGAWLIRNSWKDTLGVEDENLFCFEGYFWLSYEDTSIDHRVFVLEAETADDYENNYSYSTTAAYNDKVGEWNTVANVYKIFGEQEADEETIVAAAFETGNSNVDYAIWVYSVDSDGKPLEPLTENPTTGKIIYPGMYTIPLDEQVTLPRGTEFAVVISTVGGSVLVEKDTIFEGTFKILSGKNPRESFYLGEDGWVDFCDDEELDEFGNLSIQVLTKNAGMKKKAPVEGVKISGRTEDSISVSWDGLEGASSYAVLRAKGEVEAYSNLEANYEEIAEVSELTYTDASLEPNSHCAYGIIAKDESGNPMGGISRIVAAETKAVTDPSMSTEINSINIHFTSGFYVIGYATKGERYQIKYKKVSESEWEECEPDFSNVTTSNGDSFYAWEFNKAGLEPEIYDFSITPYKINLYGERINGKTTETRISGVYPATTSVNTRYSRSEKSITLSWDPVEGAPGYIVKFINQNADGTSTDRTCGITDADTCTLTINKLKYADGEMDIEPGLTYSFRVYVYDEKLEEEFETKDYASSYKVNLAAYLSKVKFDVVMEDDVVYDGKSHGVSVTSRANIPEGDIGEITVYYAEVKDIISSESGEGNGNEEDAELILSDWTAEIPKNAGIYKFAVDVEDGNGYEGVTRLSDSAWLFAILPADISIVPKEGQNKEEDDEDILEYDWISPVEDETPGFTGSLSREEGEEPGEYEITLGTLNLADNGSFLADNYTLCFTEGEVFTITPILELNKLNASAAQTPTSITLSWDEVPKAKGYAIFAGDEAEPVCTTARLSYTINDLEPDTEYAFTVYPYRTDYKQYPDSSAEMIVKTAELGSLSADNFKFEAEEAVYDKKAHGAVVTLSTLGMTVGDITVYYRKSGSGSTDSSVLGNGTGSSSVEAMGGTSGEAVRGISGAVIGSSNGWTITVPVDAGRYEIAIDVEATEELKGAEKLTDASWNFVIGQKEAGLEWSTDPFVYNGNALVPTVTLTGVIEGDICTVSVSGEGTDAGTYTATATGLSNENYKLPEDADVSFTIAKADRTAPAAPEAETVLSESIVLKPVDGYEYRMDEGEWQTGNVFSGLVQGKEYSFCQRIAEDANYNVSPAGPILKVTTKVHTHEWEFYAEGAVINATCKNTDGGHTGNDGNTSSSAGTGNGNTGNSGSVSTTATLTIVKPLHDTYGDGKAETATVTGSIEGVAVPEIVYKNGTEILTDAPSECGTYTASITLGNATASVEYTIGKADPVIKTAPAAKKDLEFTNKEQELVMAGETEGGTLYYALVASNADTPGDAVYSAEIPKAVNAGIYTVFFKVVGDSSHNDIKHDKLIVIIAERPAANNVVYVVVPADTTSGQSGTGSVSNTTSSGTQNGSSASGNGSGSTSGTGSDPAQTSDNGNKDDTAKDNGKNGDADNDDGSKVTRKEEKQKNGSVLETVITEWPDGSKKTEMITRTKNGVETEKTTIEESLDGVKTTVTFINDKDGNLVETRNSTESTTKKGTRITDVLSQYTDGTRKISNTKEYKSGKKETETYEYSEDELISYSKIIRKADSSLSNVSIVPGIESTLITVTSVKADGTTVVKKYEAGAEATGGSSGKTSSIVAKLVEYITTTKAAKIPGLIKENGTALKVVTIGKALFAGNTKITSAYIGKNVKAIDEKAFYNAGNLKKIYINSNVLSSVGENAFAGIADKAKFYIKAKDETTYKNIVMLIKNSGVSKNVRFKWNKK